MHIIKTSILLGELGLLTASWYLLQDRDQPASEALARAMALTLASLGLAILALFSARLTHLHHALDVGIAVFAFHAMRRRQRSLGSDLRAVLLLRREPLAYCLILAALVLLVQVLAIPPTNWDSMTYNLARVLLMYQENTLALDNYNTFRQLAFSPGFDLLHFFFLRLRTDIGVAVFSWISWCCVVATAYSFGRRQGPESLGLAVALVTGSFKLLALQATSTKNDIGAAAMACACVLGVGALMRRSRVSDAAFLGICIVFGLSVKTYFAFFALSMSLAIGAIFRRELLDMFMQAWRNSRRGVALGILLLAAGGCLAMSSQFVCLWQFGNPFGPEPHVSAHRNLNGFAGFTANLLRYALQLPDLPGTWWSGVISQTHAWIIGTVRGPGAAMDFVPLHGLGAWWSEDVGWFGPVAFILVIPCMFGALFSRDRFARAVAWTLAITSVFLVWTVVWMSFNGRFFALVFAASSACLAWAAPWWWGHEWIRRSVLGTSLLVLVSALVLNQGKPLLDHEVLGGDKFVWAKALSRRDGDRRSVYDEHFNSSIFLEYLARGMFPNRHILLAASEDSWVYPVLFYNEHRWVVTGEDNPLTRIHGEVFDIRECARFRELGEHFDQVVVMEYDIAMACANDAGWRPVLRTIAPWGAVAVFDPHAVP